MDTFPATDQAQAHGGGRSPQGGVCFKLLDGEGFAFVDLTGRYDDLSLRDQFHPDKMPEMKLAETFGPANRVE
jgi:hypothetical protein